MHYTRWKRLGNPLSPISNAPIGSCIDRNGYKRFSGKLEHISVVEAAIGKKLPKGAVVHHVDENKLNNKKSNLVVCSRGYHKVLHQRTNALNACGNANWRICSICKEYDDPKNMRLNGSTYTHNKCRNVKHKLNRGVLFDCGWQITANCQTLSLAEWEKKSGINRTTIATRIKTLGWTNDKAVSTPARKKQAIKDGFEVPGCHLTKTQSVQIK